MGLWEFVVLQMILTPLVEGCCSCFMQGLYSSLEEYFDGLVQDSCNSSTLAMELLQSCTKPSI